MIKKINNKGFTLVELLISMAIFVMFISVLINTYTFIIKAQRETNERRELYVEARKVFDSLILEFRDGMVDYWKYSCDGDVLYDGANKEICLVSKDAQVKTRISLDSPLPNERGQIELFRSVKDPTTGKYPGFGSEGVFLNSESVIVKSLSFYVTPKIDPYDMQYYANDVNQFQPMVTIVAEFKQAAYPEVLKLQTTVSSRIYNQIYSE